MSERRIVTTLTDAERVRLSAQMAVLAKRALIVGSALLAGDDTRTFIGTLELGRSWGPVEELGEALRGSQVIDIPDDAAEVEA